MEGIVQAAIARAGAAYGTATFEKTVLVGDAIWDVRTAQRLGLPFIGMEVVRRQPSCATREQVMWSKTSWITNTAWNVLREQKYRCRTAGQYQARVDSPQILSDLSRMTIWSQLKP